PFPAPTVPPTEPRPDAEEGVVKGMDYHFNGFSAFPAPTAPPVKGLGVPVGGEGAQPPTGTASNAEAGYDDDSSFGDGGSDGKEDNGEGHSSRSSPSAMEFSFGAGVDGLAVEELSNGEGGDDGDSSDWELLHKNDRRRYDSDDGSDDGNSVGKFSGGRRRSNGSFESDHSLDTVLRLLPDSVRDNPPTQIGPEDMARVCREAGGQGTKNAETNPSLFPNEKGKHIFVVKVWTGVDGELAAKEGQNSDHLVQLSPGKWEIVKVIPTLRGVGNLLSMNPKVVTNLSEGDEVLLPTGGRAGSVHIDEKNRFIKLTLVAAYATGDGEELGGEYEIKDKPNADLVFEQAVELKRRLNQPDSKTLAINLRGNIVKIYNTLSEFNSEAGVKVTLDQLNPHKEFVGHAGFTGIGCVHPVEAKEGGARAVFANNARGDQRVYIQLYDEKRHGEWNKLKAGKKNRDHHKLIPKPILKQWEGMGRTNRGRRSNGAVHRLDSKGRIVETQKSLGDFRSHFNVKYIRHDELVKAGKNGVAAKRKGDGKEFRFAYATL
ncbi:hypothetical protein THAOC_04193, partial [Thalassiosira oceanica]